MSQGCNPPPIRRHIRVRAPRGVEYALGVRRRVPPKVAHDLRVLPTRARKDVREAASGTERCCRDLGIAHCAPGCDLRRADGGDIRTRGRVLWDEAAGVRVAVLQCAVNDALRVQGRAACDAFVA